MQWKSKPYGKDRQQPRKRNNNIYHNLCIILAYAIENVNNTLIDAMRATADQINKMSGVATSSVAKILTANQPINEAAIANDNVMKMRMYASHAFAFSVFIVLTLSTTFLIFLKKSPHIRELIATTCKVLVSLPFRMCYTIINTNFDLAHCE